MIGRRETPRIEKFIRLKMARFRCAGFARESLLTGEERSWAGVRLNTVDDRFC